MRVGTVPGTGGGEGGGERGGWAGGVGCRDVYVGEECRGLKWEGRRRGVRLGSGGGENWGLGAKEREEV